MRPITRRDALARLSALFGVALVHWPERLASPMAGTIVDFQAGRLRGDWTSMEVTVEAFARSQSLGTRLHAIDLLDGQSFNDARDSDARAKANKLRGPLDGVPVFAKSIYDVRGMQTTASNADWARLFPNTVLRDAIEVERLRAAGAIIIGKTAADDFAYHGNGTSTLTGQVLNPHDKAGVKTPGGSSAGSAVSVLTGLAFGALGTDDGGSNRIPAQFSGVVGIKPTFGMVPRSGVIPTWPYLDTHGSLARSVADAALLLECIAGPDKEDSLALKSIPWRTKALAPLRKGALNGARIGIVEPHIPRAQMSAESLMVWDRAVEDLKAAGAIVFPFAPAVTRVNYRDLFTSTASARQDVKPNANSPAATANALFRYFERQGINAAEAVERGLAAYQKYYDVLPKDWSSMSQLMKQPYERDAEGVSFARSREEVVAMLAASFSSQQVDAMVYPTMPFPAPRVVDPWPDVRTTLGYGNWMGIPEISVPAGIGKDGMPAGNISFVGLPSSDPKLLALAQAYEQRSNRFAPPPT